VAVLERACEPGTPAPLRRPPRDVPSLELDTPAGREVEARDDVDERRLPGAVRPDQADDLAASELEIDACERLNTLEGAGDAGC
jgi:hypothetical protein